MRSWTLVLTCLLIPRQVSSQDDKAGQSRIIKLVQEFHVQYVGRITEIELDCEIPGDYGDSQVVISQDVSVEPKIRSREVTYNVGDTRMLRVTAKNPTGPFKVLVTTEIEIKDYDLSRAVLEDSYISEKSGKLKRALRSTPYIEWKRKAIHEKLPDLSDLDPYRIVKEAHDFTCGTLEYDPFYKTRNYNKPLMNSLKTGLGDCTEFTRLLIAVCRRNGVPAREVFGLVVNKPTPGRHNWVEVYLDGLGWVMFDPTHLDKRTPMNHESLNNYYVTISNNPDIKYTKWHYRYQGTHPNVKVISSERLINP